MHLVFFCLAIVVVVYLGYAIMNLFGVKPTIELPTKQEVKKDIVELPIWLKRLWPILMAAVCLACGYLGDYYMASKGLDVSNAPPKQAALLLYVFGLLIALFVGAIKHFLYVPDPFFNRPRYSFITIVYVVWLSFVLLVSSSLIYYAYNKP